MKVTFCGTGAGASYAADRGGSCVMIETGGDVLLVDCGPGAVRRIWQTGTAFGAIGAILITHLHYDHALGLAELFNRFGRMGSQPPRILGPAGIEEYVESCKKLITVSTGLPPHLAALHGEQTTVGDVQSAVGFEVDAIEVPHAADVQALSWRVRAGGATVVVSGDLKTDEKFMVPFAANADLLVHEAYSNVGLASLLSGLPTEDARERARQNFAPTHSEVSVVAKVAEKARVQRLALTHLVPDEDEELLLSIARQHFGGEVMVARAGEQVVTG